MIAHGHLGRETKRPSRLWAHTRYNRRLDSCHRNAYVVLLFTDVEKEAGWAKPPASRMKVQGSGTKVQASRTSREASRTKVRASRLIREASRTKVQGSALLREAAPFAGEGAPMKVEVAAQEICVRGDGNLLEGLTPAGRWLNRDMLGVKPARGSWQAISAFNWNHAFDKPWCRCSRCEQQRPRRCGRKPGETLKFRRLTLRSATGLPQRGKLHHYLFVNDIIPHNRCKDCAGKSATKAAMESAAATVKPAAPETTAATIATVVTAAIAAAEFK